MTKYLDFDEAALRNRLSSLPDKSASTFAFLCAARLSRAVGELRNVPDSARITLSEAETALREALMEEGKLLNSLEAKLLDALPTEEEDPSPEGAVLEDACAALVYAIRSLSSKPAENAAFSARRAYEAVDRHASSAINEGEYSDLTEAVILRSQVVQRELQRQQRDFKLVADGMQVADLMSHVDNERVFSSRD